MAARLKQVRAHRVRAERRHALLHYAITRERSQGLGAHLSVEFMLAAGDRVDEAGTPVHGVCQREVGGGVAGVQRYYEVRCELAIIAVNVAELEVEPS